MRIVYHVSAVVFCVITLLLYCEFLPAPTMRVLGMGIAVGISLLCEIVLMIDKHYKKDK